MVNADGVSRQDGEQDDNESQDEPHWLEVAKLALEVMVAVARLIGSL